MLRVVFFFVLISLTAVSSSQEGDNHDQLSTPVKAQQRMALEELKLLNEDHVLN